MSAFTRLDLEEKIKEIYGINEITHLIDTQIKNYVTTKGYSYLDIARSLAYFYAIENGDVTKANGIGIVPFVIDRARTYFEKEASRVKSQLDDAEKTKEKKNINIVCHQKLKKPKREKPFIDLNDIEVMEDE